MAGSRRLDINLFLDTTQKDQQEAAARAKTKQFAAEIISESDAAERAKLEFVKRANQQKIQELARANKTETELAKETAASEAKSAKEASDAKIKATRDALRAAMEASKKAQQLAQQEKAELDKTAQAQIASVKNYLAMGASMVGLSSGSAMLHGIVSELDKAAAFGQKTAQELLSIRGSVRELAALRGDMGMTGPTTGHVLGVQAQTLQSTQDVNSMESAGLGVAELAIGKTITKEQFDKAMISAGKMQTLEAGSAEAYGQIVGQIALQGDHEMNAEEVQARLDRMFKIQQPGGFQNMSQAAKQYAELNGHVMNKILTPEQAMGALSAFSVSSPAQAGTKTDQFIRATLGNQVRAKGGQVDPELDTEKTFEYMKALGVGATNDPIAIGKAIAADIQKRQAVDKNFSPYRHLQLHGFGNQQDRNVIMDFAALSNTGRLEKIEEAQNAKLQIGAAGQGVIDKRFEERIGADPFFRQRQAETLDQLADVEKGLTEEPYEVARRAAFASLKARGKMYGKYEEWAVKSGIGQYAADMGALRDPTENSYAALGRETGLMLEKEADRVGVKVDKSPWGLSMEDRDRDLAKRVDAAGGHVGDQLTATMQRIANNIEAATKEMREAAKRPNPGPRAPIQGKPALPRTRP